LRMHIPYCGSWMGALHYDPVVRLAQPVESVRVFVKP
jgi:hypothetical protein